MKKYLLVLLFILFIPTVVLAEECDTGSVVIKSIELIEKSELVKEVSKPTIDGKNIALNLEMSYKGDFVRYAITIYNGSSSDFIIDNDMLINTKDYFEYTFESNEKYVNAGENKRVTLKIEYIETVPENKFLNNVFHDDHSVLLNLNSKTIIDNPQTGVYSLLFLIPIIVIIGVTLVLINKKKTLFKTMMFILMVFIPVSIYATCKCELNFDSKIKVNKCKYKLVTDRGSFSSTEEVKEICVNDATDNEPFEFLYINSTSREQDSTHTKKIFQIDLDDVTPTTYFRLYSDSSKTNLIKEYPAGYLYNYYYNLNKNSITYLTSLPLSYEFPVDLPEGDYYIEKSDEIHDTPWAGIRYVDELKTMKLEGLWSTSKEVFNQIETLSESVETCGGNAAKAASRPSYCYELVAFTNCDNVDEEIIEEYRNEHIDIMDKFVCSGTTYHAVWYSPYSPSSDEPGLRSENNNQDSAPESDA